MSALREDITIKTATSTLNGWLYVGQDGLPDVRIKEEAVEGDVWQTFRPSQFPAAWELRQAEPGDVGILFESWRTIMEMQFDIAQAQRETEDDAKERERERASNNAIAMEVR